MDIYLDANATTPVLAQARTAAIEAMVDDYGNPSSIHSTGLKAKALIDGVRALARRLPSWPPPASNGVNGAPGRTYNRPMPLGA